MNFHNILVLLDHCWEGRYYGICGKFVTIAFNSGHIFNCRVYPNFQSRFTVDFYANDVSGRTCRFFVESPDFVRIFIITMKNFNTALCHGFTIYELCSYSVYLNPYRKIDMNNYEKNNNPRLVKFIQHLRGVE